MLHVPPYTTSSKNLAWNLIKATQTEQSQTKPWSDNVSFQSIFAQMEA